MALALYAGSIVLGLVLGAVFVVAWRIFVPRGAIARLVSDLASIAKDMARADEVEKFLQLYKRLFIDVGRYLARNIAGLVLGCLPLVLVWTLLVPPALESWGRQTDALAVYPELGSFAVSDSRNGRSQDQEDGSVTLLVDGGEVSTYALNSRLAICWSQAYCTFFALLGFEVTEAPRALVAENSFIVVRPQHNDANPFWPYLSDLEFAFFLAFVLASLGAFMLPARRR